MGSEMCIRDRNIDRRASNADMARGCEKALHHAVEAASGIKSRGLLQAELVPKLSQAGIEEATAKRIADCLERCANLRFVPGDSDSTEQDLVRESRKLIEELLS